MSGRTLLSVTVLALALSSCIGDTTVTTGETTSTSLAPTSTPVASTTTSSTTTTTSIQGGPIDFGPRSGDVLAVIGVPHDDTLNLRAAPGPTQDILDTIDPVYSSLLAQGETWEMPSAFWVRVEYEGTLGWVHMGFIAYLGNTDDATANVVLDFGFFPIADSMEELGLLVAETFASSDPPSDIVMTIGPTMGDLDEVTYDVIGLGDDSVRGLRLHVFAEPSADGFSLKSVEVTVLCGRNVFPLDGICV